MKQYILLTITFYFSLSQTPSCFLSTPKGGIDMNKQAYSQDQRIFGPGLYDIILNICKPATFSCKSFGPPAFWVYYNDDRNCNAISRSIGVDTTMKLVDSSYPSKGVIITYSNGDKFEQNNQMLNSKTVIAALCAPNASPDEKPKVASATVEGDTMVYYLTMNSKFACPDPNSIAPPPIICFGIQSNLPSVCSGKGTCIDQDNCTCNTGYSGQTCSIPSCYGINSTDLSVCSGKGKCPSFDTCTCNTGYSGQTCSIPIYYVIGLFLILYSLNYLNIRLLFLFFFYFIFGILIVIVIRFKFKTNINDFKKENPNEGDYLKMVKDEK